MQQVVLGESVRVILEHAQSHYVITTNLEFDKFEIILGTIQVLPHDVFDFFRPTHQPL